VAAIGSSIVLRWHDASEAQVDQAPLAHALLAELSPAARIAAPRLFVIPEAQPNGFAVAGPGGRIVAVTEGVFDRLDAAQLRGLFALLVASVARRRARIETMIATLALIVAPFVLPSMALVRIGIRSDQWHDVDSTAAALVGVRPIVDALEKVESEKRSKSPRAFHPTVASLCCVRPVALGGPSWLDRALAGHPTTEARVKYLRAHQAAPPGEAREAGPKASSS
jgi:heat shock protein HtpX